MIRNWMSWTRPKRFLFLGLGWVVVILLVIGCNVVLHPANVKPPDCGQVTIGSLHFAIADSGGSVHQIEDCFVQAYQHCRSVTFEVTWMGTDAGTDDMYIPVKTGSTCQIDISSQSYSSNIGGTTGQTEKSNCQGFTVTDNALVLSKCQTGSDITISRTETCGLVSPDNASSYNEKAENCFLKD